MRILATLAVLVPVLCALPAAAQQPRPADPSPADKTMTFDPQVVETGRDQPAGGVVAEVNRVQGPSLIQPRTTFADQIVGSADGI